jgi:hypothetical protein
MASLASQLDTIQRRLKQVSDARAEEMAGGQILYAGDANLTDEQIAKLPFEMYRQGYEYCWRTHAHPDSCSGSALVEALGVCFDQEALERTDGARAPSAEAMGRNENSGASLEVRRLE